MGHLLRVGNSYLSDFIESAIADSFRILESSKDEYKRILALLILKEVADNSPTHFYQHIQAFRSMILSPLKDSHIRIREAAATALSACLLVMQQRENQKKNDFYFDFLESIEELPKDNRNESIHGYLLAINSFLNNSLEYRGHLHQNQDLLQHEAELHQAHDPPYFPATALTRRSDSRHRSLHEHLRALLPHAGLQKRRVFIPLPSHRSFNYLLSCLQKDTYRGEALKAIGALALVVPDDAYSRLDIICGAIKESLNSFRWAMGEEET